LYIPPFSPVIVYDSFVTAAQSVIDFHPGCLFIICGDFNLPDISWSNDDFGLTYSTPSGPRVQCIPELFSFYNFFQLNPVSNLHGDILDLVSSNDTRLSVVKSEVVIVAFDTYHPALEIKFAINSELPFVDNTHEYFDFRHNDYTKISAFLDSFNWLETIRLLDVNSSTDALYDALHCCVLNFVSQVIYTSSKFPHWFSKNLKSIVFSKKSPILNIKGRGAL